MGKILLVEIKKINVKRTNYIFALITLLWALFNFWNFANNVKNSGISEGLSDIYTINLFSSGGLFALCGWGVCIFIMMGALWISDDLESKMNRNLIVMKKNSIFPIISGKVISLLIYIIFLQFLIDFVLMFLSYFIFHFSGDMLSFSEILTSFFANILVMLLYCMIGIFLALLFNNGAIGGFVGIVLQVFFITFGSFAMISDNLVSLLFRLSPLRIGFHLLHSSSSLSDTGMILIIGENNGKNINGILSFVILVIYYIGLIGLILLLYRKRARQ